MTIIIDQDVRLELTAEKHAAGLYKAIDENRAYLSEFLSWVSSMQSEEDVNSAGGDVADAVLLVPVDAFNRSKSLEFSSWLDNNL